jgi:murein DD-endopeptidase MepM/ murein hydrolase activator NlpD
MSIRRRVAPRLASTVLLVVALSALSLELVAAAATAEADRLDEKEAQLAEVRAEIEATRGRADADAAALAEADRQLAVVVDAVEAASQAVQRQQQVVDEATFRCEDAAVALEEQRRIAGSRAVERYKRGTESSLPSMLVADDPEEVLDRSAYLDVISLGDRRTSEGLDAAFTRAEAECRRVREEQEALGAVLEQERRIQAEAEALRNDRALTAAASAAQLDELQAQENLLLADSRELGTLARRTSRAGLAPLGGPPPSRDGWACGANGPVTSEFGARWGRMHEGIDIGVPTGSPIFAAKDGVVSFAGRQGGYGNLMLVDHGGGIVTAYAHQSAFVASAGDRVTTGQLIGRVGNTGNSTGPHLHFEVRVNGTARNPRQYVSC